MRQFLALLILALAGYFLWQFVTTGERNLFRSFLKDHGTKVFLIIVALTVLLIAQFYLHSTQLL
jgi:hypothetical protein